MEQLSSLSIKAVCLLSMLFALGGLAALPCAPAVSCSLQLHTAESGSLTCLIAFDSSLSSPVDQWSSARFIRYINVPHIPTGSAPTRELAPRGEVYFVILQRSASTSPWDFFMFFSWRKLPAYFVCFSWIWHCEQATIGTVLLMTKTLPLRVFLLSLTAGNKPVQVKIYVWNGFNNSL